MNATPKEVMREKVVLQISRAQATSGFTLKTPHLELSLETQWQPVLLTEH